MSDLKRVHLWKDRCETAGAGRNLASTIERCLVWREMPRQKLPMLVFSMNFLPQDDFTLANASRLYSSYNIKAFASS